MNALQGNDLQKKIKEHTIKHNEAGWILTFNTKLGDTIVFNFMALQEYSKIFKRVHVISSFVSILNNEKLECHEFKISKDWINKRIANNFNELYEQTIAFLSASTKDDFLLVDTGSIGVMLWNYFSDMGVELTYDKEIEFHPHIDQFLKKLKLHLDKIGIFYVFWRNPIEDVTWGRNNLSFTHSGLDDHLPENMIQDNDPELLSYIGHDVTVYRIAKCINRYLFGSTFTGSFDLDDFQKGQDVEVKTHDYILVNLNTGSKKKRSDFEPVMEQVIHWLCSKVNNEGVKIYFYELEECWEESLRQRIMNLLSQNSFKIIRVADKNQLPNFMANASAVITHCSGFSHLAAIYNSNVITFSMKESIAFINGRNPWAPQRSVCLRRQHIVEDCHLLFNLAKVKTKTSE